jgi:hypothetical protein
VEKIKDSDPPDVKYRKSVKNAIEQTRKERQKKKGNIIIRCLKIITLRSK